MRRGRDGVWRAEGRKSWRNARYAFEVVVYSPTANAVVTNVVTDPYSLGLTTNSRRSILVDLDDDALKPRGWDRLRKPRLGQSEDMTIYELHVRDFSITDETVPGAHRGTYRAFTHRGSDGMRHLSGLARAGMTALHLLPTNDIATIEENRARAAGAAVHADHGAAGRRVAAGMRRARCATRTASTGATTRCTTRRRRGRTRPRRTGRRARASTARWSPASTAPACAW